MYYLIGLITGIVFYGFLAWMLMRRQIASGARRLRNLPRSAQALIAVVAIIATVEAQKSGTNGTNNASGGTNLMVNAGHNLPHPSLINHAGFPVMLRGTIGETTSQQEIDLGYRYAYTTNDADHSFAMPTNAVYLGNALLDTFFFVIFFNETKGGFFGQRAYCTGFKGMALSENDFGIGMCL